MRLKSAFLSKNLFFNVIFLIISVLVLSCQKPITFEHPFADERWNRFNYITDSVDIQDVESEYRVVLEVDFNEKLLYKEIPFAFLIFSPDGGSSAMKTQLRLPEESAAVSEQVILSKKYFKTPGFYKFRYYQLSDRYDLEGVRKLTLKIIKNK